MVDRHVKDTWSVFKIMGEFVEGFETLRTVWPSVSIFGGARVPKKSPYYRDAIAVAELLSSRGFSIMTGGGPGVMEAANRGAASGEGDSIAVSIKLPHEQATNRYAQTKIEFNYFFARKVMFVKYACGIIGMPGGFGTLDEIFEALTLVQTRKIRDVPVVLFGTEFWSGLVDWLGDAPLGAKLISQRDLRLFQVTDDPEEAATIIEQHFERSQKHNGKVRRNGREVP
jgi:uncharacterized protein (TIGR00730 family)